ncbi:hypothetical protein ACG83_29525 [Frankia sp. R43]|nr:hypothetical protein ACG83_29525 [Frankia sp. R43]
MCTDVQTNDAGFEDVEFEDVEFVCTECDGAGLGGAELPAAGSRAGPSTARTAAPDSCFSVMGCEFLSSDCDRPAFSVDVSEPP